MVDDVLQRWATLLYVTKESEVVNTAAVSDPKYVLTFDVFLRQAQGRLDLRPPPTCRSHYWIARYGCA